MRGGLWVVQGLQTCGGEAAVAHHEVADASPFHMEEDQASVHQPEGKSDDLSSRDRVDDGAWDAVAVPHDRVRAASRDVRWLVVDHLATHESELRPTDGVAIVFDLSLLTLTISSFMYFLPRLRVPLLKIACA
eukprot:SAG11_NODE_1256_length_5374_cov_5.627627_5_plen_133_part_00